MGFYIVYEVQPGDTLSQIILDHFEYVKSPYRPDISWNGLQEFINIIMHNNPEITDPNRINPWQIIDLAPYKKKHYEIYSRVDRILMRQSFNQSTQDERNTINRNQALFQFLANNTGEVVDSEFYRTGILAGTGELADQSMQGLGKMVNSIKNHDFRRWSKKAPKNLRIKQALKTAPVKAELNAMTRFIKGRITGANWQDYINPLSKSFIIPDTLSRKEASAWVQRALKDVKKLKYVKGVVGSQWLDIGLGIIDVYTDNDGNYTKAIVREIGGFLAEKAVSRLSIKVACSLIVGTATFTMGMIACNVVVEIAAAGLSNWLGETSGKILYDSAEEGGKLLYKEGENLVRGNKGNMF
ncbi:MAG: LysM peptidoglycan-binding domain-containing protein [Halobacteriovoraceae bacterium]|nr:LysM peptidoglycan-binding domain-containing protein [Halobacteriovoraceae bacterium]